MKMAPSKIDAENVAVESSGSNSNSSRKEGEDESVNSMTSSLNHLTLRTDKDLDKLEAGLAQINLQDRPIQAEDLKNERKDEEVERKEEDSEEETDPSAEIERTHCERKKLADNEVAQEYEEKEDAKEEIKESETKEEEEDEIKKDEEEEEEEEIKEEDKKETEELEEKKEVCDAENSTRSKLEGKEVKRDEATKGEVSDDENCSAEDDSSQQPQRKDKKLRSRGLGQVQSHGYIQSQNVDYLGVSMQQQLQQQQQQQQQQQEMWSQAGHQYPMLWSPPSASPAHTTALGEWCGSPQLDSESGKTFIPSVGEYSPVSCSSWDGDGSGVSYGYGAESPQCFEDVCAASPQYQENQHVTYQQGLQHTQYQGSQPSLYTQYQDNECSPYHQAALHGIQYSDVHATPTHQGSPQYPDLYQDSAFPPHMSPLSSSIAGSSILTPPISPQPAETLTEASVSQDDDIPGIITSIMEQDHFDISPHDHRIIEIKKHLLDTGNSNLEEALDLNLYEMHYKEYARMKDEALAEGDEDGDIPYLRAACTGQMDFDYNEKLAAFTERVEKMELCCDAVVDWRVKRCQVCGRSDSKAFYSPLSWINKHGEMLLSNLVVLMFPQSVVQYITKKVMQRPMDFRRTFIKNYKFFYEKTGLYPCLLEGLKMVRSG